MIKIGLTGSIASGKTTASKIISKNRGPLFSADYVVKKLYSQKKFKKIVIRKLKLKSSSNFKKTLITTIMKSVLVTFLYIKIYLQHSLQRNHILTFV